MVSKSKWAKFAAAAPISTPLISNSFPRFQLARKLEWTSLNLVRSVRMPKTPFKMWLSYSYLIEAVKLAHPLIKLTLLSPKSCSWLVESARLINSFRRDTTFTIPSTPPKWIRVPKSTKENLPNLLSSQFLPLSPWRPRRELNSNQAS